MQFTDLGRACASVDAPLSLFIHCLAISIDPGSGGIFAWEDGTDAYNHRVRVQKRISCPECMGRGVR